MSSLAHDTQWVDAIGQAELVRSGEVSPLELLDAAIERGEQLNPAVNALSHMWHEKARDVARNMPRNTTQPFLGVPFILKDLHAAMKGYPLANGNKALKNAQYISHYTTALVQKFIDAGVVIFGRGSSPEFGSVPTTEPEAFGPTRNPYDVSLMAGGSSGGSAAVVALGIVPFAHASDGGGSIRVPASCCGLVGLKVSQGRTTGAPFRDETNLGVEFAVSRTVRDTAALLDACHGPSVGDRVIAPTPIRPYAQEVGAPVEKLKIGFLDHNPLAGTIDDECAQGVRNVVQELLNLGHYVDSQFPAAMSDASFAPKFTALWGTNMSVARDGVRDMLQREVTKDDFELVNWVMAEYAQKTSATEYANAILSTSHYRRAIQQWWADGWDILVTPTTGHVSLPIGSFDNDPRDPMKPMKVAADFVPFTPAFNTSGQPAISLPLHWTPEGIPVGIQFVAAYGREDVLIRLAAQLEVAMPWAHIKPATSQLK